MSLEQRRAWMVAGAALACGAALAACGDDKTQAPGGGPASGLAVMSSDFASTSVSLLASDGTLAKDDCLDSGSAAAGNLSMALSGDVTLPSQPQADGNLWIVDSGNAALTILDPTTCAVRNQVSVATGFKANPHDVAVVSSTKVYVTRYDKNVAPATANATGDDIVILDHDTGAITGRIDLSGQAAPVAGATIQARPDRMMLIGGKVYVTLGSQDSTFHAAGEGRVAIIDAATDAVTGTVSLSGLKGCSAMSYLEATSALFVACGGTFSDADQAAASGIVELDLSVDPPVVAHVMKPAAFGDGKRALTFFWVAALSPTRAFTTVIGTLPDTKNNVAGSNDAAFSLDPSAGTTTALGLETGAFDMGRGTVRGGALLVPDATMNKPLVHVFDVSGAGVPPEKSSFAPDPALGLPPREIAAY